MCKNRRVFLRSANVSEATVFVDIENLDSYDIGASILAGGGFDDKTVKNYIREEFFKK
jgi:hypothetical protein